MKLTRPSLHRRTADRLSAAVDVVSIAAIPPSVAAALATIAMAGLIRHGLPGLFVGVVVGIPTSLIIATLVEALSFAVIHYLTKLIESTGRSE
jgi:hypothetical protein